MKRKRIASISMVHIEDIGELEGKKSLFDDILVFSKLRRLERTRRLSFRFSNTSFSSVKKYITDLIVDIHCKNCLIERLYMFSKLRQYS